MQRDIQILRETVTKLTQLLAGRGLIVTQRGTQAYVETDPRTLKPKRINIPHIPDNATEQLILAIQGFIDHEVAHVLFTDWTVVKEAANESSSLNNSHNIVEDTFIERAMGQRFPGAVYNIERLHDFFVEQITKPAMAQAQSEADEIRFLVVPICRAWSGQKRFQEYLDEIGAWDKPLIKSFVNGMNGEIAKFPHIKSSAEALEVARVMDAILRPPKPQGIPEQNEDQQEQPGGGGCESGDAGDDDGESDDAGKEGKSKKGKSKKDKAKKDEPEKDEAEGGSATDRDDEAKEEDPSPADDDAQGAGDQADQDDGSEPQADDDSAKSGDEGDNDPDEDQGDRDQSEPSSGDEDSGSDNDAEKSEDAQQPKDGADLSDDAGEDSAGDDAAEDDETAEGDEVKQGDESEGAPDNARSKVDVEDETEGLNEEEPASTERSPFEEDPVNEFGFSELVGGQIAKEFLDSLGEDDYLVYSTDFDVIAPFEPSDRHKSSWDGWMADLESRTSHMVGPMQKDIERMMAAQNRVLNIPGQRKGKLHAAGLHKIATNDDRIFRKREEHKAKDTAVSLLIDNSGSMSSGRYERRITTAMSAAYALAQTLERVRIPSECIGFTTLSNGYAGSGMSRDDFNKMEEEFNRLEAEGMDMSRWSRFGPLYMPIFKSFDERLTPPVKRRFAAADKEVPMAANVDGECLEIAAARLMRRREKRKVLIVLSDGQPSGCGGNLYHPVWHLKKVVPEIEKAGVEVIGIGIESADVRMFYNKAIVLNDLSALPSVVMGQLKSILTAV